MVNTITPRSGWLNKLSTNNTFGNCRWQSRYFVLLDSEMRYYKDEHSITASRTISLHDISKVTITSSTNRKYCFKLEPTLYYQNHHILNKNFKKLWTIECQNQHELESWVKAIDIRLCNLNSSPEQGLLSSAGSEVVVSRRLKKMCPSISRRRGVILSPLDIPGLEPSDMLSSSASSSHINSPSIEDLDEEQIVCKQADKLSTQNAYILDTPSFATYKARFHL